MKAIEIIKKCKEKGYIIPLTEKTKFKKISLYNELLDEYNEFPANTEHEKTEKELLMEMKNQEIYINPIRLIPFLREFPDYNDNNCLIRGI